MYYVHYIFNLCRSFPGKKAQLLEYAQGLPPDVMSLTLWDTEAPPMKMKYQSTILLVTTHFFPFTSNIPQFKLTVGKVQQGKVQHQVKDLRLL